MVDEGGQLVTGDHIVFHVQFRKYMAQLRCKRSRLTHVQHPTRLKGVNLGGAATVGFLGSVLTPM